MERSQLHTPRNGS